VIGVKISYAAPIPSSNPNWPCSFRSLGLQESLSPANSLQFFLELWEDLQTRAQKNTPNKQLTGNMNIAEVASITSNTLISSDTDDDGALFDETANSYKNLHLKTEEMIVDHLAAHIKDELKAYIKINNWSSLDPTTTPAVSPELLSALTVMGTHSAFLQKTLATAVFRRVHRATVKVLQAYLWDYVVVRNTFSLAGGRQFARDAGELLPEVGGGERVREVCMLLILPVEREGEGWTLGDVVAPVFEDNNKAREVMGKLGISALGVGEVREVLKRRVEAFGGT